MSVAQQSSVSTNGPNGDASGHGIIDCDVHPYANSMTDIVEYMPRSWRHVFETRGIQITGRSEARYPHPSGAMREDATPPGGGLPASDPEYVVEDLLERYGVEGAVLIPIQGSAVAVWSDPDRASIFTTAVNRHFLERWPSVDSRFRVCITANPLDPDAAKKEILEQGGSDGVIAISLPLVGINMGNRHYHPIYEAAQEVDLPILVHPTGAEGTYTGVPMVGGGVARTYPERHALLPHVGQANLASLVFEGAFNRFPELRVIFVEWGFSWLAPFMWRVDKEWRNFRSEVPWVKQPPSEVIRERVKFTTQPIDEPDNREDLWEIMKMIGAEDVLLFSSDYPHYDNDNPHLVRDTLLPKDLSSNIVYDNAATFFGDRL